MHHFTITILLCLTSLLEHVSAAPTKGNGESYRLHRHAVGSGLKHGVRLLEKAYRRRNWTLPESLSAAIAKNGDVVANPVHSTIKEDVAVGRGGKDSGSVTAKAYGTNTEFLCPVQIGEHTVRLPFLEPDPRFIPFS